MWSSASPRVPQPGFESAETNACVWAVAPLEVVPWLPFSSLTTRLLGSSSSHSIKEEGPGVRDQEGSSLRENSMGWEQQESWRRPHWFFICRRDRVPMHESRQSTASQPLSGEWKMGRRQWRSRDMLGWTRHGKRNQSASCF